MKRPDDEHIDIGLKTLKIGGLRTSESTLNYGLQSIQTASSASASASMLVGSTSATERKMRRSRGLIVARMNKIDAQSTVTSSTFYSPN